MKSVTVPTKDVSHGVEVKDCFRRELGYKLSLEDMNADYIKRSLGVDGC